MKKHYNQKQTAILAVVFTALVLICVLALSTSFSTPIIAQAYNGNEEIYYAGTGLSRNETESFAYATKAVEKYLINPTFPDYYNTNNALTNTCANVGGANIIGYYDRYYSDLIPNVTAGYEMNNVYTYFAMNISMAGKQAVINDLYVRMQTNSTGTGNTQAQYKNGLSSYVQAKGLTITYSSVMTNGKFDLEKAKAQFQNGNPISLFMSGFNFTQVTDSGSIITLDKRLYDANHIAIAYGYEKVIYYNAAGGVLRTDIYLKVSTGLVGVTGVYLVNEYGTLNDAESAYIK